MEPDQPHIEISAKGVVFEKRVVTAATNSGENEWVGVKCVGS